MARGRSFARYKWVGGRVIAIFGLLAAAACSTSVRSEPDRPWLVRIVRRDAPEASPVHIPPDPYRVALARARLARPASEAPAPLPQKLKDHLLDEVIRAHLLAKEAEARGIQTSSAAVSRELAAIRGSYSDPQWIRVLGDEYLTESDLRHHIEQRLARDALLAQVVEPAARVSDEDVMAAWQARPPEGRRRGTRVRARHIAVRAQSQGDKLRKILRKSPERFEALARSYSRAPEASRGGDLGWFGKGEMPKVFEEACFALKKGGISPLVASEYGFHIFQLIDREEARPLTLNEARPDIEKALSEARARRAEEAFMKALRAQYDITINQAQRQRAED